MTAKIITAIAYSCRKCLHIANIFFQKKKKKKKWKEAVPQLSNKALISPRIAAKANRHVALIYQLFAFRFLR